MIPHLLRAATLAVLAAPALAMDPTASALAVACPAEMAIDSIVEPWDQNSASYANGDVRIALIDLIEPAAAAFQLVVLHPPRDELGGRQCHLVAPHEFQGFPEIRFDQREADYDPERGLVISMPIRIAPGHSEDEGWSLTAITINQRTGEVRFQGAD